MTQFTALVMAANRQGPHNVVAAAYNVSHKCLVQADGVPMVLRVVRSLQQAAHVGRIVISIDDRTILDQVPELSALIADGTVELTPSGPDLFSSVFAAANALGDDGFPLVICTADSALQTPQMVDYFCGQMVAGSIDVAVGMTPEQVVSEDWPEALDQAAFHRFRNGGFSTANLYGILRRDALDVATVMRTGGQFRIRPMRVLKAFGLRALIVYRYRLATLDGLFKRLSRRFGLKIKAIVLPFADAAVDVDGPHNLVLVEKRLAERRRKAA